MRQATALRFSVAGPGMIAAAASDDASRCLLLALSHDALGVIVDGLADPLQPVIAVALSSTCKGLRTSPVLERARLILMQRHFRAVALCETMVMSCEELSYAEVLEYGDSLDADDLATLGMIVRTSGLPRLHCLDLSRNFFGNAGLRELCKGLGCGAAPSLITVDISYNGFCLTGAEALAAVLLGGAMPKLATLCINDNHIGNQGIAALVAPLRKLPALKTLNLTNCEIGDEGVASLVDNLDKNEFKRLERIWLKDNLVTDAGCGMVVTAVRNGALPMIVRTNGIRLGGTNPARDPAIRAVKDAIRGRA